MAGQPARLETKDQEPAMTVTTTGLTKAAGVAAAAAGAIFIGVQLGHPQLNLTTITTTDVFVRDSLKVLMAALAVVGLTGMYLSQIRRNGVLGLVGYVLYAAGYLSIMCTTFVGAFVLPTIAGANPGYVKDFLALTTSRGTITGDLGALSAQAKVQGILYLAGGVLFGVALVRAHVLARWAAVLLAVSGLASVVLSLMPDAFYRLLAYPNGIAMIGLGVSLWLSQRKATVDAGAVETRSETSPSPAVVTSDDPAPAVR